MSNLSEADVEQAALRADCRTRAADSVQFTQSEKRANSCPVCDSGRIRETK